LSYFLSEAAWVQEKEDVTNLRRAKRELSEGLNPELDPPVDLDDAKDVINDPLRNCQVMIATRMNHQFDDRVIRRSLDSLDWKGRQLLNLPECRIVHGRLDGTARETQILRRIAHELKEE